MVAIVGIAVFHTFSSSFGTVSSCLASGTDCGQFQAVAQQPWAVWLLGIIMLLGSWGNHVFYMISGFFLIPSAVSHVGESGYWRSQLVAAVRRALAIVAAVALYWLICYLVSRFIIHIPAATIAYYWTMGIEFIWLYVLFVLAVPFVAWVIAQLAHHRAAAITAGVILALVLVATYALNVHLALTSSATEESFALTDWRKWISAITYVESFLVAGVIGLLCRKVGDFWASRRVWAGVLTVTAVIAAALFAIAVAKPQTGLLNTLTFKSTSPLAFLLALATVMTAALAPTKSVAAGAQAVQAEGNASATAKSQATQSQATQSEVAEPKRSLTSRVIMTLASATLGFYMLQAATRDVWEPALLGLINPILNGGSWGAVALWMLAILAASVVVVLIGMLIDLIVRRPLFRALHLVK